MKRSLFLGVVGVLFVLMYSCKKDKKNQPDGPGGGGGNGEYILTDVQVVLPSGSSFDLSQTTVFTLSKTSSVGADGKARMPYNSGRHELAYLFDASQNLIMVGFISDDNKEISVGTTAQALLYFGLGASYATSDAARIAALKKITSYTQFADFRRELEQMFSTDPLMLSKNTYRDAFIRTTNDISDIPVLDIIGKQVKVQDADETKSGITVKTLSDEHETIELSNQYERRAHAFFYKTAYKDLNNNPTTIINTFYDFTAFNEQIAVKGNVRNNNNLSQISGPVKLPLQNNEKEATWKTRIVGPGKVVNANLTNDERSRLEQLWVDFFAIDLLMPHMLHALGLAGARYTIIPDNIEAARPFTDVVKSYLEEKGSALDKVKNGNWKAGIKEFADYVEADYYKRVKLASVLLDVVTAAKGNSSAYVPGGEDLEEFEEYHRKSRAAAMGWASEESIKSDNWIETTYKSNTFEEWTVKVKGDDVAITPKHSQTMRFSNHTLAVSANPELSSGQTLEYEWSTAGVFGVLKSGSTEATTITTTSKSITYYGKEAPGDDNVERVTVTAYIKNSSGTKEVYGTDTATINVKKVKIEMRPDNATLSPKKGLSALKLALLNADGTNPIVNNETVQYKVEWSTAGKYGHFSGNTTQISSTNNTITYIGTDEDVKSGTENITARVMFKLSSQANWMLREEVKGSVKIENDSKKIIYYTALTSYHDDRADAGGTLWHYSNCGVAIKPVEDALNYSVQITLPGVNPSTYSESWSATSSGWLRGYMYGIDPATTGTYYVGYGAGWGGCPDGDCDHTIPDCSGGQARVTITLK